MKIKTLIVVLLFTVTVFAQSDKPKADTRNPSSADPIIFTFQNHSSPAEAELSVSAFSIFAQGGKLVVSIGMDGKVTYGPAYEPNEAAKEFWQYVGHYAPGPRPPAPEWVPDPSAGHYDCPDGWTAFARSEPFPLSNGPVAAFSAPAIFIEPSKDKKGHVLAERPEAPICVRDAISTITPPAGK